MTTSVPDEATKLRAVIAEFPQHGFAVLDGAHFEDLPALFRSERLFARSLFLDHADKEVEAAGPWLIGLGQSSDALDRVLALVGDIPAIVFWSCRAGEAVLYRHLRTLNMALIPDWAAAGRPQPIGSDTNEVYTSVMFRHWDPRVLASLMPVLDAAQFSRVMGPAEEIALRAPHYGGVRRAVSDPTWPRAAPGLLRLSGEQLEALTARRLEAQRRSVAAYLIDASDGALNHVSAADIRAHVVASEARAHDLGIVSEAGQCRWAFLMMITRGQIGRNSAVAEFVRDGAHPPDRQVEHIMDATSRAVRGPVGSKASGLRP